MTGPMTFLSSPKPLLPDQCDAVDAFGDVSAIAADNYSRFNTYLTNSPNAPFVHVGQSQISGWEYRTVSGTTGGFVDITDATLLTPITITLPNPCAGLLGVMIGNVVASGRLGVAVGYRLSGPGIPTAVGAYATAIGVNNQQYGASRLYLALASELVPGQQVTLYPQWRLENAIVDYAYVGALQIHMYAFRDTL
jgi:hypothetical protein